MFPRAELLIPGSELRLPRGILAFPGWKLPIPGRKVLLVVYIPAIKPQKLNKGAGVPFYDSIATYDSGLMYDDPSSPQPTRKKMAKVRLGLRNLTRDQKIDQANTIKTAMTGEREFPDA